MIQQFFQNQRIFIERELRKFFANKGEDLLRINSFGGDLIQRISEFSLNGKMIRGGLIILIFHIFKGNPDRGIFQVAGAMEVFHSSLLIHDDIMDRDELRRGKKSIYYQYKEMGEREDAEDPYQLGENLGICAGDIGFFLALEILNSLKLKPGIKEKLITLWSRELQAVCLAQMEDIYFSSTRKKVDEGEILNLYRYKTARYTFSLPMESGAIIALEGLKTIKTLEKLGEYLGIIFQIKDDDLGIFGTEGEIGKTVGTDIKERKKTLHFLYIEKVAQGEDREKFFNIINNREITPAAVLFIKKIIEKYRIRERVNKKLNTMKEKALHLIESLDVRDEYREMLYDLLEYNMDRKG